MATAPEALITNDGELCTGRSRGRRSGTDPLLGTTPIAFRFGPTVIALAASNPAIGYVRLASIPSAPISVAIAIDRKGNPRKRRSTGLTPLGGLGQLIAAYRKERRARQFAPQDRPLLS
jgi:hypothetical protein